MDIGPILELAQEDRGAFLLLLVVAYFAARGAWQIGANLWQRLGHAETQKDAAVKKLVQQLEQQHTDCQARVQVLEGRVLRLEDREQDIARHNIALNSMVLELRRKVYPEDSGL